MKSINIWKWLPAVLIVSSTFSCNDTWVMYDRDQKSHLVITGNDTILTSTYSIVFEVESSFIYEIPISIMGLPAQGNLTFEVEAMQDDITSWTIGMDERPVINATNGIDFEVGNLIIEEGKTRGKIPLKIYRKDYMSESFVSILLKIKENDNYQPMYRDYFRLLVVDGEPACPAWWTNAYPPDQYHIPGWAMYLGKFTPEKYRRLLSLYWETEETNPIFYNDIYEQYGRYLSEYYEGEDGQLVQTRASFLSIEKPSLWATYVLVPLCEYYKEYYANNDPDEEDEEIKTGTGTNGEYWRDPIYLLR